jgi:hypothetical protein
VAESDRERARRVLSALRSLPPGALETAEQNAQGANGVLLAQVRAALATREPEDALAEVLRDIDPEIASAALDPRALFGAAHSITAAIVPVRAELDAIAAGQRELAAEGERVRELALATDPELVPLVEAAIDLLCDDTMFATVREAVEALGGAGELVSALAKGQGSPRELAARMSELRAHRDKLQQAQALLADVPALLAKGAEQAQKRGDLATAARLVAAEAALRGDAARWRVALDLALASDQLPAARAAASRVELVAAAAGRLDEVAAIAAKLADLAARAGDPAAELAAVGDQALVLAQLGGRGEEPHALVERARALVAGDAIGEVRVQLLAAQVAERLGDEAGARRAFRKVMERARDLGMEHVLGWASLHLGRLEASAGQRFRAGQELELAQHIGRTLADPALFALALGARVEVAPDRAAAERLFSEAADAPASVRDELRRRIDARWDAHA